MKRFTTVFLGMLFGWRTDGVAQDAASARYGEACDGGDGSACVVLGMMYERGDGMRRDPSRAVTLYRTACEGGELSGCVNLGVLVEAGVGIERDAERARELYTRACDGGQPTACDLLAALDGGGSGGPTTYFKTGRIVDADTDDSLFGALLHARELGIRVTSDADGGVSLGRVPAGRHRITVERFGYEPVSGEIDVPGNAEFVVMLPPAVISDPSEPGRIVGRVADADGGSLRSVEISIAGEPTVRTVSNVEGGFELSGLTPGLVEVRLALLGYATRTTHVVLQPGGSVELAATMSQQAIELEPIEVMVRSGYLDRSGFYRRAQQGWGTFFTPEDIERLGPMEFVDLIQGRVPGVTTYDGGVRGIWSRRSTTLNGLCAISIFMDGVRFPGRLDEIDPDWLEAVEVYHGVGTPIQYEMNNSCGAALLWTRQN